MAELVAAVAQTPAGQTLLQGAERGGSLLMTGVSAAAQPAVAALLGQQFPQRSMLIVTEGLKRQEAFFQDLQTWSAGGERPGSKTVTGQDGVGSSSEAQSAVYTRADPATASARLALFYPAWESLPHEDKLPHADVIAERLETLVALAGENVGGAGSNAQMAPVVVTSVTALLQRTFAPAALRPRLRRLRRGDQLDPLDLVEWLEEQAYEPEAQVSAKGELALRGGIVDVFPLTSPWPVRLEFFGNEIESLRFFDPATQISREEIGEISLPPAGELGLLKRALRRIEIPAADTPAISAPGSLLDYLPPNTIVILCEPERLEEQALHYAEQAPAGDPFFFPWDAFQARAAEQGLTILSLSEADPPSAAPTDREPMVGSNAVVPAPPRILDLPLPGLDTFRPLGERAPDLQVAEAQRRDFFAQLHRWLRQGLALHVFCNNDGERQRFAEVWQELGFSRSSGAESATASERPGLTRGEVAAAVGLEFQTHIGTLSHGFLSEAGRFVVVTDAEIFGRYKVQRIRRLKSSHAVAVRSALDINFSELEIGDFVVHLQHGIGRYAGLQRLPATTRKIGDPRGSEAGRGEECLAIEYAARESGQPAPRLYVPVTEAHLVSKYVGAGKARPPLNVLGSGRWAKAKAQAAEAVRDLAAELLSIQAARASQAGFAFPPDTPWQREFEGSFLYEETPDQLRAIEETRRDLEQPRPMDRLICGDVGFGKTEVAIRAAFKTVMAGKQVAILVPTTVLAQQHFNTFSERMADYPISIDLLSRFRSRRQQNKAIQDLAVGAVDIVIGTHRLIQKDIVFKDLGLVVIDEEQRFGVAHKEKFKLLRRLVDVLTLSATPIPRTLYLALTGARDMSTIETPPQDRLPVETIIAAYDERLIRDAIRRELNRGGQVFFLHNRVLDIQTVALKLRTLVPEARISVGHGQMDADELEEVMTRFINGEADVLLSTTIIESGIDIPNANTIIIDRADRFGLSDLYQLRGRVGRYKHQAYAYLLIPRHAGLLADARKRITAIKQFSTPGSGFKIAMRDLEIRGAGNLLGSEQSGHITAVGFELYCQLLKQSVASLKGEPLPKRIDVNVRLDFLDLSGIGEAPVETAVPKSEIPRQPEFEVAIPREVASYVTEDVAWKDSGSDIPAPPLPRAPAGLPLKYVPEPKHRIEIYRKLAQATDKPAVAALRAEIRDRFGSLPPAVELLFQVADLKMLAAERAITAIETRGEKLMLTRGGDFLQVGGRFPRLSKQEAKARLNEIRKLLLAL